MRGYVVGLLAVGLLAGAGLAQDDAVKKETKRLEGMWIPESAQRDGKDHFERLKDDRVIIEGDKLTVKMPTKDQKATFKIDPSKKPATIDLTFEDANDKAVPAIYELKGDTLKICFSPPGTDRPTEFTSEPGSKRMLIVMKRAK